MMNGNLLVLLLVVPAVEYFFRVPFFSKAQNFVGITKKSMRLITSRRISDHWKEIVLLRYSRDLILTTFFLAFMLLGPLLVLGAGAIMLDRWLEPNPTTLDSLTTLWGLVNMTLTSVVYLFLRKYIVGN